MVDIEYIEKQLNEFFGTDHSELIVMPRHEENPPPDISELASYISDSEVTCVIKGEAEYEG